jgi:3-methyladenine DNA glycosylase/8-oxoguanine DNA glycosylase
MRGRTSEEVAAPPAAADEEPIEAWLRPSHAVDLHLTLAPMRHGPGDPTIRFEPGVVWRSTRTPLGPATLRLASARDGVRLLAWGPGAATAIEQAPRLLGGDDDPAALRPRHAVVRELQRRSTGLRFGRTDEVFAALVPAVIEQKVTGLEARRSFRALVRRYGEPAPGPGGLRLPPAAERLADVPYHELHPLGLEARRATTILRAARVAPRLERASAARPADAMSVLRMVLGVGQWTAAETARVAWGDPDAVSVGDFHVPNLVAWALCGEPRADDARMLELLEPYRGQRARVVRLLEAAGLRPPRFGPRMAPRSIAAC